MYPTFLSASGVTKILNGDFSNNDTGWTRAATTLENTGGVDDSKYVLNSAVEYGGLYQTGLTLPANRRYFISFYTKITGTVGTNTALLEMKDSGATVRANVLISVASSTSGWTRFTTILTPTADCVRFGMSIYNVGTSNTGIDNISIVDVTDLWNLELTTQPIMLNTVRTVDSSATLVSYVIGKLLDSSATTQYGMIADIAAGVATFNATAFNVEGLSTNMAYGASQSVPKGVQTIQTGTWSGDTLQVYDDGSASGVTDSYSGTLTNRPNMTIGARSNNADGTAWSAFFKGYISEIIICKDPNKRNKLEKDQKKYYGL
jgi:hypothetical protein